MKRTESNWRPVKRGSATVLLLLGLVLLLAACGGGSFPPRLTVEAYLSDLAKGRVEQAIQRWELSELGPDSVDLDEAQKVVRMKSRQMLALALTDTLGNNGERLSWERPEATYYGLEQWVTTVVDNPQDAETASVSVDLIVAMGDAPALEESLTFNLWRNSVGGWRIVSLDKGLPLLSQFLDKVSGSS